MADIKKTFHQLALESILFKGRQDWYYCYLKTEKIAHVLVLLSTKFNGPIPPAFLELTEEASGLPATVSHFAAGETDLALLLADLFSVLSGVRLVASREYLSKETALLICAEYERVIEKMTAGTRASPFVSAQDFAVPELLDRKVEPEALPRPSFDVFEAEGTRTLPSGFKGQSAKPGAQAGDSDRSVAILQIVRESKGVSIKDIAAQVRDCSEKTIQRELGVLIEKGLIKREGERRWSVYKAA